MLCFDPTRGIDIGTKQQIYELVRELAASGAAVLFYTSELKEVQLACDRAIVMFGGRIVAEIPIDQADEATLLRAAYDLPADVPMPEEIAATELEADAAGPDVAAPAPGAIVPVDPTGPGTSVSA
jgi:ribose transport system ATP-binding protein